jgi:hypothetical protein
VPEEVDQVPEKEKIEGVLNMHKLLGSSARQQGTKEGCEAHIQGRETRMSQEIPSREIQEEKV